MTTHLDDGCRIYFSGDAETKRNGVAIVNNHEMDNSMLGYNPVSDRIMTIRFHGAPFNLTIIQVYAPTAEADEKTVDAFYDSVQNFYESIPSRDIIICVGNLM